MLLKDVIQNAIEPALLMLPDGMDTPSARVMLLAIGLQESRFENRRQFGNGPARGFWQFEKGGGVHGVMHHPASDDAAVSVCGARSVRFDGQVVYNRLAVDDVLAAAFARLLLWTDPKPLPTTAGAGWDLYERTWRPGKPHPETWPAYYAMAQQAVMG